MKIRRFVMNSRRSPFASITPSMLSIRRATLHGWCRRAISIHAPYIGSDVEHIPDAPLCKVSIHAPYIGSDAACGPCCRPPVSFNPRSLHRERLILRFYRFNLNSFNPRSLHRERHDIEHPFAEILVVSIHAPYIGSDVTEEFILQLRKVSIHAPYIGSDGEIDMPTLGQTGFNPRSLHRERLLVDETVLDEPPVSIHAPYIGSDSRMRRRARHSRVSIHAPYIGSDSAAYCSLGGSPVSIHAPYIGSDVRHQENNF